MVFDSFQGPPDNAEWHAGDRVGNEMDFTRGTCRGSLAEVKANVARFGCIGYCRFVEGWFEDTLPGFHEPVATAYMDVELASSTRTCLKHLYPRLLPGGVLYSRDGPLPQVMHVLGDRQFWLTEFGGDPPRMEGLGTRKLVRMTKPAAAVPSPALG